MKTSVVMTSLCLGALASGAFAADVSIKGNVDQTVEASDNYFLSSTPLGGTAKILTAGTLDFLARTSTTQYLLDTHYSYYKYFGPGADDQPLKSGTPASATFRVDHTTELSKYNLSASWSRTDVATTQLAESGTATAHGTINTYSVNGGVTRDLGRIDSISWTAGASTVSFTDSNQTPYVDVTSAIGWNHSLSQTTTLTDSVNLDWLSQDDAAKSQRLMWTFMTGLQSQLSKLLTFHGNVGMVFSNAYQNGTAQSPIPPPPPGVAPFQLQVGAGHGWIGNVGLSYKLLKDTSVSLTASQAVIPTFTGQLQQTESIGMSLSHDINQFANLSFSTQYSQSSSPGQIGQTSATSATSDFFSASANFGYRLTREWRTSVNYTYAENVGVAKSNMIRFTLSRDFTLLGNPAAINKAQEERAVQRTQQSIGQVFPGFQ